MMKHKPSTKILVIGEFRPHTGSAAQQFESNNPQQPNLLKYDIKVASTGSEGLRLVQESRPDCILLNYTLPDMDVREFLNASADNNREFIVPVVLLIEQEDKINIADFTQYGVHDCLVQGKFDTTQFTWAIFGALEKTELQKQLQRQQEELKIFADHMAQDLISSLSRLSLYAEYLEMNSDITIRDAEQQHMLGAIVESVDQAVSMVHSFRDYAYVERLTTPLSTVNLNNILDHILLVLRPQIDEVGIQIHVDSLPTVVGDPMGLGQLLQYLVSNAIEFATEMKRGRKYRKKSDNGAAVIYIKTRKCGNKWQIGLTNSYVYPDNYGREDHNCSNSFAQQQKDKHYPVTNIELAICKKIVEQHGGAIWFCSTPTQGITSYFTLEQNLRADNGGASGSVFDDIALLNHPSILSTVLQKSIDVVQSRQIMLNGNTL